MDMTVEPRVIRSNIAIKIGSNGKSFCALYDRHSNNGQLKMPNITRCYIGGV